MEVADDLIIDASPDGNVGEELARKEQQKKHYFYLNKLQGYTRELQAKYQQRLPYDLLCSLANALLDGTVFEIVTSLREVQQLEERNLSSQRIKMLREQKSQRQKLVTKHMETIQRNQAKPHNLPIVTIQCQRELEEFDKKCEEEVKRADMKIILALDQKMMDQQTTLEKAGVPGFFVTNKQMEVRLQMFLLDYVTRLSQLDETIE